MARVLLVDLQDEGVGDVHGVHHEKAGEQPVEEAAQAPAAAEDGDGQQVADGAEDADGRLQDDVEEEADGAHGGHLRARGPARARAGVAVEGG